MNLAQIPEWESVDCEEYGFNSTRECILAKRDVGIPWNFSSNGDVVFDQCKRFNVSGVAFSPDLELDGGDSVPCDAGWEYDIEDSTSTIDVDVRPHHSFDS